MISKQLISFSFLLSLFLVPLACQTGSSARNESCLNSGDCKDGLRCVNLTCVLNEYPIEATAKECVALLCKDNADCCLDFEPAGYCADYQRLCDEEQEETACQLARSAQCVCQQRCESNRCITPPPSCTSDTQCSGSADICDPATSQCVQCLTTDDCDAEDGEVCRDGSCEASCKRDEDCPLFYGCAKGECTYKGCTTDRECILLSNNPNAVCREVGGQKRCSATCEQTVECGALQACKDGECVHVGCETKEECISYFKDQFDFVEGQPNPNLPPAWTAECREATR